MSPSDPNPHEGRPRRIAWRIGLTWHRRIGLAFGLVFLVVAVTGIALDYSIRLGLHNRPITSDWLYRWYGMQPEGDPIAFNLKGGRFAVGLSGSLYLDDRALARLDELRGAVSLGEVWVAAGSRELLLLTPTGEWVERLESASLPPGEVRTLGLIGDAAADTDAPYLVLIMTSGRYQYDRDLVAWSAVDPADRVEKIAPAPLSDDLRERIIRSYRGDGLTLYRIMLDLHSGRFFGLIGVLAVTLSAVAMGFLTLTGTAYALRRRRRKSHD